MASKLLARLFSSPRYLALFFVAAILSIFLLANVSRLSHPRVLRTSEQAQSPFPAGLLPASNSPSFAIPFLQEYTQVSQDETPFCAERFGNRYLADFRDKSHEYCHQSSNSKLKCFHSKTRAERTDTFCLGTSATFNATNKRFYLNCGIADPDTESVRDIPAFAAFSSYWYDTGPKTIFTNYIELSGSSIASSRDVVSPASRDFTVLLKREGEGNLWHCLMEIISMTLTFDVLRLDSNRSTNIPLFTLEDIDRTQVILLDDHPDGPYIDLWRLFSKKPILRLDDLTNTSHVGNIIIPLAGGASPFWQGDWDVLTCDKSSILHVFITRVLAFFDIQTIPEPQGDIVVTFINRVDQRRLLNQEELITAAKVKIEHVNIQIIDLAAMSFKEQITIARNSDVLIGVHGAGLTHGMWLRSGSVVAEILPEGLNHKGFRNLAGMLNHKYFSAHADKKLQEREWHSDDVYIDERRFVEFVELAVKSVYNRGSRSFDVV